MSQQPRNQGQVPTVPPTPLPFSTTVTHEKFGVQTDDGLKVAMFVVLYHSTPGGMTVAIWSPEHAKKIARDLMSHAKRAEMGDLVLPDGSNIATDKDFGEPEGVSIDQVLTAGGKVVEIKAAEEVSQAERQDAERPSVESGD